MMLCKKCKERYCKTKEEIRHKMCS